MSDLIIHPVILCGGSGTRLWPLSRKSYPKQFAKLLGDQSLFQGSVERLSGDGFADPTIITGDPFRFIVTEQLAAIERDPHAVLIEPEGRNTAPAVLAAALNLAQTDPDALMLVAPSDHVIEEGAAFRAAIMAAAPAAQAGSIVTFGIRPTAPETAYGYLQLAEGGEVDATAPQDLAQFVEKPQLPDAESMIADGRHLWNAGIFLMSVQTARDVYTAKAPDIATAVEQAVAEAKTDLGFCRLASEPWSRAPDISIDFAIMEKVEDLKVMPVSIGWSDLGGWSAVHQSSDLDEAGNAVSERAIAIDCEGSLLRAVSDRQVLVGIGLQDMIAVAMNDAVLVAPASESQRVKEAVTALKAAGQPQATQLPRDYRPWGWYESLIVGNRFQVKRIVVHPGAALSLQSHVHRSEHWIVVEGTAKVTVDEEVTLLSENQSVYIPLGAVHRMENPGKVPMVLIEVQTGSYLGEDDIIRYEDVYART
ncbi:mannose-1-phosphate guanylyltransferase/mannose-6-phosphate isomerase [Rhodobacteraceae bacterium W635]|uniref:mannose-1-phosphate guanylyltransferase/mannose-6-phosphate isomerase n=1 Tax=Nioella halotolerans TaxID=2303578 RepID=UPI000E3BF8A4|nr:mannose-1-phosphate guanylyltransferase/mannose-6-phosphate isomerase [Rhodobacteraceae bacterium W635]